MTTAVTAKSGSLAQRLGASGSETTILLQSKESWASVQGGTVKIDTGESREWVSFTSSSESLANGVYSVTLAGCVRGLKKDATSPSDALAANKKNHAIGVTVSFVYHSYDINLLVDSAGDNDFSGDNTVTGSFTFVSTAHATFRLQNVTTVQRLALTGLADGVLLYDTTLDEPYIYAAGAWYPLATGGSQPDATESVKGVAQLATITNQQNADVTGSTGAGLALQPRYLIQTSAGAADAYKIVILDGTGFYDDSVMPESSYKFGGTGADGAQSGALTVTGSDNTYIVLNYTSFTPGANTVTVTPTNCIVHIRVSGNANLTGTTFDFKGKGAAGGTGGANNGTTMNASGSGSRGLCVIDNIGIGVGTAATTDPTVPPGGAGGTNPFPVSLSIIVYAHATIVGCGSGGGGGSSGSSAGGAGNFAGNGGNGARGGGAILLEVAGDCTFSSTSVDVRGNDGSVGANWTSTGAEGGAGGGGGGGGGGSFLCLVNGTITGSPTVQSTGGAGGAGGSRTGGANSRINGSGGGGGASVAGDGVTGGTGAASATTSQAASGGAGAAGASAVIQNTVIQ